MKLYKHTKKSDEALMRRICREYKIKLVLLEPDEGKGGYNYSGSAGREIMLAPFVKSFGEDRVGRYIVDNPCRNPLECRLAAFFHELAHAVCNDHLPCACDGYSWNRTSKFQHELWITMMGFKLAMQKYGIKFSDRTVQWMLREIMSYIHPEKDDPDYGLHALNVTDEGYTVRYDDWYETQVLKKNKDKKDKKGKR